MPLNFSTRFICRSNNGNIEIYDKIRNKYSLIKVIKKTSTLKKPRNAITYLAENQYNPNLVERAVGGQFDQVTLTYEEYLAQGGWGDPSWPTGWAPVGDEAWMYWVPDYWSNESLPDTSDLHAAVYIYNDWYPNGVVTTLDATGGQYVRIVLDSAYNDPVDVYLDDIKLGTVSGDNAIGIFDISNGSWTQSSILKAISATDTELGTTTLIRSLSLMALDNPLPPIADFTASLTSGTAPFTVQFNDTSTGSPINWSWSFGDGESSTLQNPVHEYTSTGTYTVNLTVANTGGSNMTVKAGYVTVTAPQTTFYVYAEGVGMYHGTQADLSLGNETPEYVYNLINGRCGTVDTDKCWSGRGLYLDDNAGSIHWNISEQAGSYADNADFSVFAGHGWNDGIIFGTPNTSLELSRSNMRFGGNRAKWVTFFACDVLNESTQSNWESVFNGIHIVNGFDQHGLLYEGQGTKYESMRRN